MSFPKRMLYGTKELWNKILEEINGIKTWCDNRFVLKSDTSNTHAITVNNSSNAYLSVLSSYAATSGSVTGVKFSTSDCLFRPTSTGSSSFIRLTDTIGILTGNTTPITSKLNNIVSVCLYCVPSSVTIDSVISATLNMSLNGTTKDDDSTKQFTAGKEGVFHFFDFYKGVSGYYLQAMYDNIDALNTNLYYSMSFVLFVKYSDNTN